MAISKWGPDIYFVTAAGLSENPSDHEKPEHQMSLEFATFLKKWEQGDVGRTEFHMRNFKIATRKGCYPEPLLDQLGIFTEAGLRVLARAKSLLEQVTRYYQSMGLSISAVPTWEDAASMDTILLAGQITHRNLTFLKTLHNHAFPVDFGKFTMLSMEMPVDIQFQFYKYNGISYLLTGALRNLPHRRKDFELLVKYGLVDLTNLPKPLERKGRGRAPVGATLTVAGVRFFEHFLDLNDPGRVAARQRTEDRLS
jgi:hypothetical protein